MNYNKYAAFNKRNRQSYHKSVGGGKYGLGAKPTDIFNTSEDKWAFMDKMRNESLEMEARKLK